MRRVGIGVQEADGDRFDRFRPQLRADFAQASLVQRPPDTPIGQHALRRVEAQAPLDQGRRFPQRQVVHVIAPLVADLDSVAEAGGRQQRGLRALAFDERIGDQRGAMRDIADRARMQAGGAQQVFYAFQHRGRGIGIGRQQLFDRDLPALHVEGDDVGEGAADIDCKQSGRRGHTGDFL